jgi:putative sigma-54 modulation protein
MKFDTILEQNSKVLVTYFVLCYNLFKHISNANRGKGVDVMRYIISGKNIDVTESLKTAVYEKIGKLERYFTPDTEIHVTLSVEKERQKIEVTIPVKGSIIRAEETSNDMYVSIDLVEEIIERQLRKYKNKLTNHKQASINFNKSFIEDDFAEDDGIKIVKTKRFAIKPMDAEEACVQMELLGHNFYVFRNANTDEVNVVYKRKGNTYGLIEPEY